MKLFDTSGGLSSLHRQYKVTRHEEYTRGETTGGLSVLFTILCIVDLFGVFPVVALPKSVIACGVYAVPLVLLLIGLQLYTAMLLGRSWLLAQAMSPKIREKIRYPYAAVAELAFGNGARRVVTFMIDATVFGAGIPNFIFASQSMQLFWWKISEGEVTVSYCVWMLIIGLLLCPVMWLGSPKDMKTLAVISVCIVTTVAVSVWSCILTDSESPPSSGFQGYSPGAQEFLVAYGIMAFQFDIHPMLLTIQVDMKDSSRIKSAVLGGFGFTVGLFAVTTALAAYRYGNNLDYNILQGIPPSFPLFMVALLVTVQLCLSSAVGNSALFQHIEDLLGIPREFCFRRCFLRSGIVAFAVFLGETVPRFDLVMGLVGSTLTGPLMFIFPPLIFLKLCHMKANETPKPQKQNGALTQNGATFHNGADISKYPLVYHNALEIKYQTFSNSNYGYVRFNDFFEHDVQWYEIVSAILVMVMGISATVVATVSSWSNTITYATFTPPCLFNSTAAARSLFLSA